MMLSATLLSDRLTRVTPITFKGNSMSMSRLFYACPALLQPVVFEYPCFPPTASYQGMEQQLNSGVMNGD